MIKWYKNRELKENCIISVKSVNFIIMRKKGQISAKRGVVNTIAVI